MPQKPISALFDLSGRRALVTGGNAGIGLAMARALGLAGAEVLLLARREAELAQAVLALQADGIRAAWQAADLCDVEALRAAAALAESRMGGVDILVNAAGVNLRQPFAEVTPQAWHTQIALHLTAPFFLTQALASGMQRALGAASSISRHCKVHALLPTAHPMARARAACCNSRAPLPKNGRPVASLATPWARASFPPP